jgi:hypothetical protein
MMRLDMVNLGLIDYLLFELACVGRCETCLMGA